MQGDTGIAPVPKASVVRPGLASTGPVFHSSMFDGLRCSIAAIIFSTGYFVQVGYHLL